MVFQWFLVLLPSLSMVFDGFGPLVKRCDGFDGSLWSSSYNTKDSVTPAIKIRLEAEMSWHLRWGNIRFLTAGILNSEFRRFRLEQQLA